MGKSVSTPIMSLRRSASRPMSRDKADTLLLLVSCTLVLAPHTAHLPLWISLLGATLLAWRGWITFRGNRMPPKWLLLPISVVAMASVHFTYNTFFGRDSGVAMVVLLLALKLLEMRAKRDLFVVVLVSFFVMLTTFFYSQSMGIALMMIAALISMLTTQLSFQYTEAVPPFAKRLQLGALIFGISIPLALILFVLFPRIQGPLWSVPGDANAGRTGLSDSMAPGSMADLAQSDEVAFRSKFIDPPPPQSKLYWRALVFDNYDGRTWTHGPRATRVTTNSIVMLRGRGIRHQVTLEPTARRWLFALDLPSSAPPLPENPTVVSIDMQLLAERPINERVRYDVTSFIDYDLQPTLPAAVLQHWLQLPPGFNPKTLTFAAGLRTRPGDNAQMIDAVLQFFRGQKFSYTLQPPLLGKNAVDEFLFTTQAGFCEHYAGAFVVLMRAMNIPARVVTGYQGGAINPVGGFMEVRQSDAHAWAEVWLDNRGWVRVDPTAAVAPERVQKNLASVIPRATLGGLFTFGDADVNLLSMLRLNWGAINNAWNQWVLNFSPEKQKSIIHSLGFEDADWRTLISLMSALSVAALAIIAVPLMMNRQKIDPVQVLFISLCKQMARLGYPRATYEGPRAYGLRLTAADSSLTPPRQAAVARFLALYESIRYGIPGQQLPKSVLSQLKFLLTECK